MKAVLLVGAGGAFGAIARYLVSVAVTARLGASFPWATLLVNVSGCFAIGFLITWTTHRADPLPDELRLLLPVGFVGAYTTFSTFEWETLRLVQQGAWWRAAAYVALSTFAGFLAVGLATALARRV